MNKVELQNWLWLKTTVLFNKINIITYFENLTIELHIFYTPNTHSNFVSIRFYLLCDLKTYILYIILNYKN